MANDPEDYPEENSMSNDHNARYGHSLLRRINDETVLNEAKRMLLARAGVTEPDAGEQAIKLSRAFEELCPSLSEQVRALTNPDREPVAALQILVDRRQSELAQQALRDADAAEIERAVQRLRETFGATPGDELRLWMLAAIDDALRLAGAVGGQRVVKIIDDSALGVLEDLESCMAEPIPHEIGDPDRVPMALTLREILEHCAMVQGANEAQALWIIRQALDHAVRWLGADDLGLEPRGMLDRITKEHDLGHDQAVAFLGELRDHHA